MARHLGDYDPSTQIFGKFSTYRASTGAPFTLAGTPAISVYKDNSTTQSVSGVALTADFDALTGLNHFAVDTATDGTFYSAGSFFDIVITTGTVDGISVVGTVIASFTLRKDSGLKPTTAARTLDVSATGEAGLDWANIGAPTTAQVLSGTSIGTATALGAQAKTDVNNEVLDVLNVDTFTEPVGAPPSTASFRRMVSQIYMLLRNRITVTNSTLTVFSDASVAQYTKALADDGTTFTESEAV